MISASRSAYTWIRMGCSYFGPVVTRHIFSKVCSNRAFKVRGSRLFGRRLEAHLPAFEAQLYLAGQVLVPVSATLAMSHLPSTRTMLKRSVPQWSTLPSTRKSKGAQTTARSLSIRTSGS